jgi:hypothetical protein
MSYAPQTDFIALLRLTSGGVRAERMPGLDYIVSAMARAGLFTLSVGQSAPTANQKTTVWFRPAVPSWSAEGAVFLYDTSVASYVPATPALWSALLFDVTVTQTITAPGPANVLTNADVVLVNQTVSAPIALTMPLSSDKSGGVLISDWKGDAGANNIRVTLSGADVFPGGLTVWTIAADTASIFLRPVPGGYAL